MKAAVKVAALPKAMLEHMIHWSSLNTRSTTDRERQP